MGRRLREQPHLPGRATQRAGERWLQLLTVLSARRARQLFALHRWTGLTTGLVILFLSVTGSIVVFKTEIDRWLNPELLVSSVPASASSARDIGFDGALRSARERFPGLPAMEMSAPRTLDGVYSVWMRKEGALYQVTVNPHTGAVLGGRDYSATFVDVMRQTHVRFFAFGWQGRVVVGAFGLTLIFSSLTGLLIYGRFIRALPQWWSIRTGRGLQISTSDWHKLIGILTLAFNLLIAASGAVLGLENLARFSPAVSEAIHPGPAEDMWENVPATLEGAIPVSSAIARVRSAIEGFEPGYIVLPAVGGAHYQIYGNLSGRIAMENASGAIVHALSGEVLYRHSGREARLITKAYNWMDPLHFGYFGGIWTKLLWALLGLTSAFLSISGFAIWWLKARRRPRSPRGQLTRRAAGTRMTPTERVG
ncbi:MAG: hypothetical protein GEU90_16160 [Gemmatimonas sp.]|nr:hypothetical protein [Gemmatimonas sp.]